MKIKIRHVVLSILAIFTVAVIGAVVYVRNIHIPPPDIKDTTCVQWQRTRVNDSLYFVGNNWLHRSSSGLWEVYLEGNAFERGVAFGKLTGELLEYQEDAFVEMITQYVPSPSYLNFLRYFVAFFNRNLPAYIPEEYLQEIYGVSLSASSRFDFIAPPYLRQLNYHAAHDIGHALQNMNLVGCTSFALWDDRTQDNQLLIGRNFDFYAGERFAENKLLCFVNPDTGYPFVMIGWAGMCGVLSGMNNEGLTVTINAAKSGIPTSSAMPVSLLAREILQYASTIEEAQQIAEKRQVFISESFLIGSLSDNKTAIIEKTPEKTTLYTSSGNQVVCTNHFQSKAFADDIMNIENIRESDSPYRHARVGELLEGKNGLDEHAAASILRETRGMNNQPIGYGNEKSINQLIAHHSVIFRPSEKKLIVSTHPYQLGEMKTYRMDSIFSSTAGNLHQMKDLSIATENIPADTLLYSMDYTHFLQYRQMRDSLKAGIDRKYEIRIDEPFRNRFISSNPEMYYVYLLLGDWYASREEPDKAVSYWKTAISKEIPRLKEKEYLEEKIRKHEDKITIRP